TPLLPACPPYRHQHGLRSRTYPGPTVTIDLAQDNAEADGQLGAPVGGVQPRLTQEGEQLIAIGPHVPGQTLSGQAHVASDAKSDIIGERHLASEARPGSRLMPTLTHRRTSAMLARPGVISTPILLFDPSIMPSGVLRR